MKKLVLSNIQSGVRKLGAVKATLEHIQESYTEAIASMFTAFIAGASTPIAIHGCVNSGAGSTYNISAGSIYHNGEVFEIDAFAGTAGGGQVPVLSLVTTWRAGDPAKYSDGSMHNTHSIRKYQWSFGASGSGLADFSAVVTLKSRINDHYLDVDGQVAAAVAALVDAAPGTLDTLNELAAALGDDPNFATTVTNSIAAKVAKAGDTMTGALVNQQTIEAQGGFRSQNSGPYLKKKVIEIGDWDMLNGPIAVYIATGLADLQKIRSVSVLLRSDTGEYLVTEASFFGTAIPAVYFIINSVTQPGKIGIGNTVDMRTADWDSTGYNRGWLTIEYEV